MSLYGMIFGKNPASDVILATLDLTPSDVGRLRDVWVEKNAKGETVIGVYTRNGGGNRECWCYDSWGDGPALANHTENTHTETVERGVARSYAEEQGYTIVEELKPWANGIERVLARYETAICDEPESASCRCAGCVIEYVLPLHPDYLYDVDDEFDSTYATIYFRAPEQFEAELSAIAQDEPVDPSAAWDEFLTALASSNQTAESAPA